MWVEGASSCGERFPVWVPWGSDRPMELIRHTLLVMLKELSCRSRSHKRGGL